MPSRMLNTPAEHTCIKDSVAPHFQSVTHIHELCIVRSSRQELRRRPSLEPALPPPVEIHLRVGLTDGLADAAVGTIVRNSHFPFNPFSRT